LRPQRWPKLPPGGVQRRFAMRGSDGEPFSADDFDVANAGERENRTQ
jgi:hypothetical protein